jgi:hypothetical protein
MHGHDGDRYGGGDVPDIDMAPFDNAGILGDDVMGADVRFSPPPVVGMHDDGPTELDSTASNTMSSVAAAALAVSVSAAARVPSAESDEPASDPVSELVSGPSPARGSVGGGGSSSSGGPAQERIQDRGRVKKPERDIAKSADGLYHCTWPACEDEQRSFFRKCEFK